MSEKAGRNPTPPKRPRATRGTPDGLGRRLLDGIVRGWMRLLEMPGPWLALLVLAGTGLLAPEVPSVISPSRVPVGSIATRDYIAPRDLWLPDEESTQEKERRAREEVLPVYDFDAGVIAERQADLQRLFAEGRRFLGRRAEAAPPQERRRGAGAAGAEERPSVVEELTELLQKEPSPAPQRLTPEQIALLLDKEFSSELEDRLRSLVRQALQRGVVGNKTVLLENRMRGVTRRNLETGAETLDLDLYDHLGYPDELQELLESEVRDWPGLAAAERRLLVGLLLTNLQPNLYFNQSETLARRDAAAASVERVFLQVRDGQVVVRKGDEIDATTARVLAELAGTRRVSKWLFPVLGTAGLLLLAAAVLWIGLEAERVADHGRRRRFSEGLLLLLASLAAVKLFFIVAEALSGAFSAPPFDSLESYLWAVPYAALALLAALLCSRNTALMLALLLSVLAARLAGEQAMDVFLYSMAGSLAAIFAVDRFQLKQRVVMARIGLLVGLVNVLMVLLLLLVAGGEGERGAAQLGFGLLCAAAGGLLTSAAASFALPILESLLGITTDIKLVELANTNLPLLRRLAFEAPGTFQHSLMVANLAKEGCEAIGADTALAYTGALYHDIGKIFRPDYFIENQRTGINPHDKLQPSMSALVLINHVKDGVELARKYHLPQPILDSIEQHHGNRLITFFYRRALERCDPDTGEVREEKYRYPGPRPRNKVQGVLMLADGVEAASRTLTDPTPVKIRGLIRKIVEDCLQDRQLDLTDLTLSDIKKVSEAFLRVLANLYHHRVDYPGFEFNEPQPEAAPQREAEPRRARVVAKAS